MFKTENTKDFIVAVNPSIFEVFSTLSIPSSFYKTPQKIVQNEEHEGFYNSSNGESY